MKKVFLAIGGALVLALAIGYATLVAARYAPEACTYELDLKTLRALSTSLPGDRPREIRVEHVTSTDFPRAVTCPGQPWERVQFRVFAYQLVFPDRTILVDTAMNPAQAKSIGMTDGYDEGAWQRVTQALARASAVYVTHEHVDHMGGAFADDQWAGNLRLTPPQLDSTTFNRPSISPTARAAVKTIAYEKYQAVAPGVVLINAHGHTPGSQMVFITRSDGAEVILTGDTAWLMDNIEHEQGPARLVTLLMSSERNENACQLAALHRIQTSEPAVAIMPGHDKARMQGLLDQRIFVSGFVTRGPR